MGKVYESIVAGVSEGVCGVWMPLTGVMRPVEVCVAMSELPEAIVLCSGRMSTVA